MDCLHRLSVGFSKHLLLLGKRNAELGGTSGWTKQSFFLLYLGPFMLLAGFDSL